MSADRGDGRREPLVIALFGPTGVGKTAVAIELAALLRDEDGDAVAIGADALQVYSGLETLTGAASPAERARLDHRLVGFVPVTEAFSVGDYMPLAHAEIDAVLAAGRTPIVVGGTGLYLRAALSDLDLRPPPAPGLRERIEAELSERGAAALHERLALAAPAAAEKIRASDRSRLVRALELVEMGEEPPPPAGESNLWTAATRHPTLPCALVASRDELYARIDARVDAIVVAGAADEVRRAAAGGASATARKALGFEELIAGDLDVMKRRTRNYAKRQMTWLRKLPGVHTIGVTGREPADVAREIVALRGAPAADSAGSPPNDAGAPPDSARRIR